MISLSVPGKGNVVPDFREIDDKSFWDSGISALMITNSSEFRNPHYHSSSDKPKTLNYAFMARAVKAFIATVCKIAEIYHSTASLAFVNSDTSNSASFKNFTDNIKVFPNPVHSNLSIEFANQVLKTEKLLVTLATVKVNVVFKKKIIKCNQFTSLNVLGLEKGNDFLNIKKRWQ